MFQQIETPQMARPAFVGWQAGVGRQDFANDAVVNAAMDRQQRIARRTGRVQVRRIPAATFDFTQYRRAA